MTTDPKNFEEQKLNEILKKIDQPQDELLEETALQRALTNIQKIGRGKHESSTSVIEKNNEFTHLARGDRLGDFVIDRKIAQGGMGVIYSATQEPITRMVALKTIIPGRANNFILERFRREREILGRLHESNIVSLFAAGTQDEVEYFAMPYIEGLSVRRLDKHIKSTNGQMSLREVVNKKLSERPILDGDENVPEIDKSAVAGAMWRPSRNYLDEVVRLIIDLADGVQAVHDAGYIHRDITPNNVVVDTAGRPWLIDFGIATSIPADATSVPSPGLYTQSVGGQLGTPRYKAPELKQNMAGRTVVW